METLSDKQSAPKRGYVLACSLFFSACISATRPVQNWSNMSTYGCSDVLMPCLSVTVSQAKELMDRTHLNSSPSLVGWRLLHRFPLIVVRRLEPFLDRNRPLLRGPLAHTLDLCWDEYRKVLWANDSDVWWPRNLVSDRCIVELFPLLRPCKLPSGI